MRIPPDNMTIGEARQHGRLGDEQLVHLNRHEVRALRAMTPTGQLTRNPVTGEEEAFLPFLLSLLPALFPGIGTAAAGATGLAALANPLTLGAIGSGLGTWAETGDLGKGLAAGLGGYALGGLMGGAGSLLGKMGAGALPGAAAGAGHAVGQAAGQAAQNTAATAGQALNQAALGPIMPEVTTHTADLMGGLAQNGASAPMGWLQSTMVGYPGEVMSANALNDAGSGKKKKKPGPYDTEALPVPRTIHMPPPGFRPGIDGEWNYFDPQDTITQIMNPAPATGQVPQFPGFATGGLVGGNTMTAGGFGMPDPKVPPPSMMDPAPRPMGPAVMPPVPGNTGIVPPQMQGAGMGQMPPQGMPPMPQGMPSGFDPQRFMDRIGGGFRRDGFFNGDWRQRMMDRRMGDRQPGMMPPEMQRMDGPGYAEGGSVSLGKPYDPAAFDFARAVIAAQPYTQPSSAGVVPYQAPVRPVVPPTGSAAPAASRPAPVSQSPMAHAAAYSAALGNMAQQASGQNPSPFPSPNNRGMPVYQNPTSDYLAMMEQINGRPGVREFAEGGRVPLVQRMRDAGQPMSRNVEDRRGYASRQADRQALRLANRVDPMDLLFGRRNYTEAFQPIQQLPQDRRAGWRGDYYGNSGEMLPYDHNSYARGGYVMGPGDGVSDSVPAVIDGQGPAKLSDGEFVVPADAVAHIGNGSNRAGAKKLDHMVKQVRKKKTGRTRMPPRI